MKAGLPANVVADAAAVAPTNELVFVHGGGDVVTDYATRLGKEQRFVVSPDGIRSRYTDRDTAEIYQMVMCGLLANRLASGLGAAGVKAVTVSGADSAVLRGARKTRLVVVDDRGRKVAIDGGFTGKVKGVNAGLLGLLLSGGYVPVVSPVAAGEEGEPLNVDGDRAASAVAVGTAADSVVFLTDVDGLTLGGALVRHLSPGEASARLPEIGFGMQKKVMAAVEAVEGGVKEAIISSGRRDAPLTRAFAHDSCTVIARS